MDKWLTDLGLGKYHEPFAENDVDASVFPLLTCGDLTVLGVQQVADGERGHIKIDRSSVQMSGKQANGRFRIWKQQWGRIPAR